MISVHRGDDRLLQFGHTVRFVTVVDTADDIVSVDTLAVVFHAAGQHPPSVQVEKLAANAGGADIKGQTEEALPRIARFDEGQSGTRRFFQDGDGDLPVAVPHDMRQFSQ